jgi:hypothetical protein
MSYDLVFTDPSPSEKSVERDIGENVVFSDLPSDYRVYALYFPAEPPNGALENSLRDLGRKTAKNLMMYFGSQGDPNLDRILPRFEIKSYPVIVVTALADLASPVDDYVTTYARLDSKHLLNSPERAVQCVEILFSLFLQGEVAKAISQAKWTQRTELASSIARVFGSALKAIGGFIAERDIVISLAIGKLELKRSGGK